MIVIGALTGPNDGESPDGIMYLFSSAEDEIAIKKSKAINKNLLTNITSLRRSQVPEASVLPFLRRGRYCTTSPHGTQGCGYF